MNVLKNLRRLRAYRSPRKDYEPLTSSTSPDNDFACPLSAGHTEGCPVPTSA